MGSKTPRFYQHPIGLWQVIALVLAGVVFTALLAAPSAGDAVCAPCAACPACTECEKPPAGAVPAARAADVTPQSHQTHHAPQQQFSWDKPGKANLVEQQLPWMTVQVRSLIASYLKKESTVMLEYGGGGSTLFFGPRVKQLYTVESVKQFVERINGELQEKGIDNVQVAHAAPDGYYKDSGEVITGLHGHKRVREMAKCDVVPESSLEFWKTHGGPQGIKLPNPPQSLKKLGYKKFKGNWEHNSKYIQAPAQFGVSHFDAVLIDGVARGACAFWILDYIDENSRVFIHDFYNAGDPDDWDDRFNLEGLKKYYFVVAKVEELSPYSSGGTVVVLQKKVKAELNNDIEHMNKFQKDRISHRKSGVNSFLF